MLLRLALLTALLIGSVPALAHEYEVGNLSIFHPFAAEVKKGGGMTNAYMTITNDGNEDDVLLRATSPIATSIDIVDDNDVVDHVDIDGHESLKFKQRGVHLVLNGIKKTIKPGVRKPITLYFKNAGEVKAQLLFSKLGEVSLCDDGHHDKKIGADKRN